MLKPGDLLNNRYEIEDQIGQGGMSYVYRAHDRKLGRTVAIKVLKEEFSGDEEFIKKFRNEAMAAAKLSHQNIVAAYDAIDEGGLHYIIMELVEGITLKNYIARKGRLSNRETLGIALQAAEGIAEAHRKGIIHRDIKPQNMIISKDGKVKVADFGIAKAVSGETISVSVLGSVHYISPEQAKEGRADVRSDIYSLGISMYEMITGRLPYEGDNTVNVVMAHISETMVPPSVYNKDIYPALCDIIMKATRKNPEERYQTMPELIADLKRCVRDPEGHFVRLYETGSLGTKDSQNLSLDGKSGQGIETNALQNKNPLTDNVPAKIPVLSGSDAILEGGNAVNDRTSFSAGQEQAAAIEGSERNRNTAAANEGQRQPLRNGEALEETALQDGHFDKTTGSTGGAYETANVSNMEDGSGGEDDSAARIRQFMKFGAVAAGILVLLILALIGGRVSGLFRAFSEHTETTASQALSEAAETEESAINFTIPIQGTQLMPDLTGMTEDAARAKLKELQLSMDSSKTDFSDVYMEGRIINQTPKDGEAVTPGDTVYVTISKGTKIEAALESIVGMSESSAKATLADVGVSVSNPPQRAFSDDIAKDLVTGWELVAEDGTASGEVTKGSSVVLILSNGKESDSVKMPLLTGMTKDAASSLLSQFGLKLGSVDESISEDIPAGLVMDQSVSPNTELARGTAVNITISTGNGQESGEAAAAVGSAPKESTQGTEKSNQYYYGRIDTTCQIGSASGPDSAARQIMVYIGLSQRVDGAADFTVLEDPKPVSAGSKIPITFNEIRGAYGVSTGEIQVLDAETNDVYGRFTVNFSPREGANE